MSNKIINTRIQLKHDIEANWLLKENFCPLEGEIIIYDADTNYSYPRFKIGDGQTDVNNLPFFAGSWNDLSDKPFYEEISTSAVGSDSVTWDGNTDGHFVLDLDSTRMVLISDVAPTYEYFANGFTVKYSSDTEKVLPQTTLNNVAGLLVCDMFWVVPEDNYSPEELDGLVLPKRGIYCFPDDDKELVAGNSITLTIPGYTGFGVGDTSLWDGNTEGLTAVEIMGEPILFKISDATPGVEDCKNGVIVTVTNGNADGERTITSSYEEIVEMSTYFNCTMLGDMIFVAPSDNYTVTVEDAEMNFTFPEAGIYVMPDGSYYTKSITIPGYGGFTNKTVTVKQLDEKYIPDSIARMSDIGDISKIEKIPQMEASIDTIEKSIDTVERSIDTIEKFIDDNRDSIASIDSKFDVDDLEHRIDIFDDTKPLSATAGATMYESLSKSIAYVQSLQGESIKTITTGTGNGQIKVYNQDNTSYNVSVFGLGTAAYTGANAYATAAQGAKADTAVQPNDLLKLATKVDLQTKKDVQNVVNNTIGAKAEIITSLTQNANGDIGYRTAALEVVHTDGKIQLKVGNTLIGEGFSDTDFVKDGFLNEVKKDVENNTITFVWNTDAGKQETVIDIDDLVEVYTGNEGIKVEDYVVSIADGGVTTDKLADGAVGAEQTKASIDYTGDDAEVWVFNCGTSTINI